MILSRPHSTTAPEFFHKYIELVKCDDPIWQMEVNHQKTCDFVKNLPSEDWDYRYQEGKWSVKELLIHMIDTERILSTRAMRISRGEVNSLTGFDHEHYNTNCEADNRSVLSIVEEYKAVRNSTLCLFKNLVEGKLDRIGKADNKEISPRALAFIIAGHEMHHMNVIAERYFPEG